ncbi:MAG: response regulator [Chloroflexia bacterium]
MGKPLRVVLADDHAMVRQGIRQFLEEVDDIVVVAEAADGQEALRMVARHRPDVVVLDIQMPGMNGIEATREIRAHFPEVRLLILTAYDDDPYIVALLRAGADGYILKSAEAEDLVRAVREVAAGRSVLSPEVARRVVQHVAAGGARAASPAEALTEREVEVLRLTALGLSNKEIGRRLGISARTVQGHLANIYGKLGVNSRTAAVMEGQRRGWIFPE